MNPQDKEIDTEDRISYIKKNIRTSKINRLKKLYGSPDNLNTIPRQRKEEYLNRLNHPYYKKNIENI